jgi:DNA polymerase delta subunit 1
VGAEVHSFEDEKKLLEQWRDFVVAVDPDVITGYNIINFDLPYLLNRSEHLGVKKFGYLGRLMGSKSRMKDTVFSSKAYGTRESVETNIDGRVQFDLAVAAGDNVNWRNKNGQFV